MSSAEPPSSIRANNTSADTPDSNDNVSTSIPRSKSEASVTNNNNTAARSASTSQPHLNPRSCITCRKRKVRCNKENPCSNCVRAGIDCIFPGPGRAPRKSRKPPDAELLARLRRLEGVVHSLGAQVDENGALSSTSGTTGSNALASVGGLKSDASPTSSLGGNQEKRSSIDKHIGRLVIDEDRSRYVSNQFWASMGDEIAEMRDLLDVPSSEEEEEYDSPDHDKLVSHQAFIFGYSSLMVDLKSLHPSPSQIFILWEVFKDNVDPVVRLLHRPTAKNILMNAASSLDRVSRAAEALLFAIYFGAVVSLTEDQCIQLLGEHKDPLMKRYRFATEQALARADFLNSSSLMCLQAFIFFLVFVRHVDDSRTVWALGGMAIHIAQALGIHRDGTNFNLNPFDTEMRRRLWWHVSLLDNRASEDHGTDPTFSEQFYDTKLPLNINDDDIYPEMKEPPVERIGATEMTFCLLRFEISVFSRRLHYTAPGVECSRVREQTLEEKEKMIDDCRKRIEDKYLKYCDMTLPIYWVTATVARLILAKMWLLVHHPRSFAPDDPDKPLSQTLRDRVFITSIETIEFSSLLEKSENTAKWGWLFRTYMQWQAVAFVLSELCRRQPGPDFDRAWRAVESVYDRRMAYPNQRHQRGMLWKPMRHLMAKAKIHRAKVTGTSVSVDSSRSMSTPELKDNATMDPWMTNFPTNTFLSASAEALDFDISGMFPSLDNVAMNQLQPPVQSTRAASVPKSNGQDSTMQDVSLSPQNIDLNQPDFMAWSGWNTGVGDFNLIPDPQLNYFNNMQQEWF